MVMHMKFAADVHLGKLARLLRMMGFDTAYDPSFTPPRLRNICREEDRVLLSRSSALAQKDHTASLLINDEDPYVQLRQVLTRFDLKNEVRPFSRCLICNGLLEKTEKENLLAALQENTARFFNDFWQCRECKRIYWKGSHYEKMRRTIERIIS